MRRPRPRRRADGGFTLLEVLVALLLGMIGLLGTVAIQQTVLGATQNANDAAIALRLATQTVEEFSVRQIAGARDDFAAIATGAWSPVVYVDANGKTSAQATPAARWARQWRVVNLGIGLPYNISVQVTYNLDGGNPKTVRLDIERRK